MVVRRLPGGDFNFSIDYSQFSLVWPPCLEEDYDAIPEVDRGNETVHQRPDYRPPPRNSLSLLRYWTGMRRLLVALPVIPTLPSNLAL